MYKISQVYLNIVPAVGCAIYDFTYDTQGWENRIKPWQIVLTLISTWKVLVPALNKLYFEHNDKINMYNVWCKINRCIR